MDNTEKQATFGTQNTERRQSKENNKHNTEKKKRWATRTLPGTGWNQAPANGNQFLPLIRHPPCYSYPGKDKMKKWWFTKVSSSWEHSGIEVEVLSL
jgi:hypothetical protein